MTKQIIKIGSSLGLTLPASEIEKLHLKVGDEVQIIADDDMLKIIPVHKVRPVKLAGLWKNISIDENDIQEMRKEAWGDSFQ